MAQDWKEGEAWDNTLRTPEVVVVVVVPQNIIQTRTPFCACLILSICFGLWFH